MNASRPTAVIDKSLFQELCGEPSEDQREFYWSCLRERYRLVVPLILIEELLVNAVRPGAMQPGALARMMEQLTALHACWADDVFEMAFTELVERQPARLAPSDELLRRLSSLQPSAPELAAWVESRGKSRRATVDRWRPMQRRLAPPKGFATVAGEAEFLQRTVLREFERHMEVPTKKQEMLEAFLGGTFRQRHRGRTKEIDEAFMRFAKGSLASFPVAFNCIAVQLAYVFGPIVKIMAPGDAQPRTILVGKKRCQENNLADAQYVITGLIFDRLLTRDAGMSHIAGAFRLSGLWNGRPVLLDATAALGNQIPTLLI